MFWQNRRLGCEHGICFASCSIHGVHVDWMVQIHRWMLSLTPQNVGDQHAICMREDESKMCEIVQKLSITTHSNPSPMQMDC